MRSVLVNKYETLLSPIEIAPNFVMKNRMIKAPQSSWRWNLDNTADDSDALAMYENMAAGGLAAINVAAILWEPAAGIYLGAYDDKFVPGMKELTAAIHKHDCLAIGQLHHIGPSGGLGPNGELPVGASSLTADEIPVPAPWCHPTRGLSIDEIHEAQRKQIEAAVRLKEGGFDAVEVHIAHGYFLNSFVSPLWNKRDDKYGCQNIENRTRIVCEIIRGIREACGPDFVIGCRLNGREFHPTKVGITPEWAADNAKAFVEAGAQYISVAGYGYGPTPFRYCPDYFAYPEPDEFMEPFMDEYHDMGLWTAVVKTIKDAVDVPVMTAGRMDEDLAERVLEDGDADIIALGRTLWADPHFARKVAEGRTDEIMHCTRCASCEDPVTQPRICRVNPTLGQERQLAAKPAETKKRVMVVGGGPAGMECALTLAERGHDVTIYEKTGALGGRTKLAAMIKSGGCEEVMHIFDYLTTMIEKSDVKVSLKTEVDERLIRKVAPDAVVVANSSPYFISDIPGMNRKNVFTIPMMSKLAQVPMKMFGPDKLASMSEKFFPVGKKVLIWGAGAEGAQCAEFMRKRGKEIVLVAENDDIGGMIPLKYKERILPWFERKNVQIVRNSTVVEFTKKGAIVRGTDGSEELIECDSMMVMLPEERDPEFFDMVRSIVPEAYEIGSTLGGENAFFKHAFADGRRVGCLI